MYTSLRIARNGLRRGEKFFLTIEITEWKLGNRWVFSFGTVSTVMAESNGVPV